MVLGASIADNAYHSILDIGTGTGVLALMAKQKNPESKVLAIDIDEQSLVDCRANFENSLWSKDLTCLYQNFTDFIPENTFDCIICNPPFYENGLLSEKISSNRAKHAINFSIQELLTKVKSWLQPNGHFWLILPYSTSEKWNDYGKAIGLFAIGKRTVFGKPGSPKRMILKFSLSKKDSIKEDSLTIRNHDNSYTEMYKQLTSDFHNRTL